MRRRKVVLPAKTGQKERTWVEQDMKYGDKVTSHMAECILTKMECKS